MDNLYNGCSKEELTRTLNTILALELYGIFIEKTKEIIEEDGTGKIVYFFSVPESSTMELDENDKYKDLVKTSDGLIKVAKDALSELLIESFNETFDDDEMNEEDIEKYIKFYAKVRTGDHWSIQKGKEKLDATINSIKNPEYKSV